MLAALASRARRTAAPHRRRAGAQRRHDRRQHRQRLADRRHAAAADRARRDADAAHAARSAATMPLEDFFIAYGKQDRQPGRVRRGVLVPKLAAGERVPRLQDLQALRPGHLGGLAAPSRCVSTALAIADARIAFGGMAATPKRAAAAEAALIGAGLGRCRGCGSGLRQALARLHAAHRHAGASPPTACWPPRTCCAALLEIGRRGIADHPRGRVAEGSPCSRFVTVRPRSVAASRRRAHRHDSAARHVAGTAVYIDDLPEPAGTAAPRASARAPAHAAASCGIDLDAGAHRARRRRGADRRRHPRRERRQPGHATTSRCSPTTRSSSTASRCSRRRRDPRCRAPRRAARHASRSPRTCRWSPSMTALAADAPHPSR